MSVVLSCFWIQWIEVAIGKSILILYHYGFYTIDDTNKSYSLWHTFDENLIIRITDFKRIELLYFGSFLLWHYDYSLTIGMGGVMAERVFATIFISDYEKKSRTWIPILIVSVVHLMSIPYSYMMLENKTTLQISLGLTFSMTIIFITCYYFVLKLNRWKGFQNNLTLSQKFQVKENIRAITILKTFVLVVVTYVTLIGILLILLSFGVVQGAVLDHLLENMILFLVLMSCSKVWSQKFFPLKIANYFHCEVDTSIVMLNNSQSAMYFNQLKNAWI
ncbi:unnamed protein product [Caenorhabditis angaria]|uniref:Uncharacterized protein n=1 Tax=Caenorhabditis angaria TaxID=860376 RepID=A0A9P1MX80_9PELO|nr:unnamed protein product [Caenorhabditis angaria]